MALALLLRSVFRSRPTVSKPSPSRCLAVEPLEDRTTPSTGGVLDPTFGSGGIVTTSFSTGFNIAEAALVQPDGKVVAAGWANMGQTGYDFLVARYNANGSLDTSFGSGGRAATDFNGVTDEAYAVALQPGTNGKLLAGGFSDITVKSKHTTSTTRHFALVRYNTNGTLDTSFGTNGKVITDQGAAVQDAAYAMAVQSDGRIILAGLDQTSGYKQLFLVRYTANGALDPTFGSSGKLLTGIAIGTNGEDGHNLAVGLQADGRIVVATSTSNSSSPSNFLLARFNANGTNDTSFGGGTGRVTTDFGGRFDQASTLAIQSDGRIVVAGYTLDPSSGVMDPALARYNPDGSLDASFGVGGTLIPTFPQPAPNEVTEGEATDVAIQTDGRIVVGGRDFIQNVTGSQKAFAERFNPDGTVDTGYGPAGTGITEVATGTYPVAHAMAIQTDGKVVFAGQAGIGSATDFALFRLLPSAPQIGSFTSSANPVTSGSSVTLTASNITDANPNSTIQQVTFYYIDGSGNKVTLGTGTQTSSGVWTLTFTVTLAPGSYTLYAQAEDSDGVFGDPFALALTVQ